MTADGMPGQGLCDRAHQPLPPAGRQVVHGTPITPLHRLAAMAPTSFCISFWNRRPLAPYLARLAPDGMLLLDCGAYNVWQANMRAAARGGPGTAVNDAFWDGYYRWALPILQQVPQAVAIIPDVIGGTEEENRRLVMALPPEMPADRMVPVWHLDEGLSQLEWMVHGFGHVAFGSAGDFRAPGSLAWRQRVHQALALVERICGDPANGVARTRIHLLRGLGPMRDGEHHFASGDSTNLARNGHLWARDGRGIRAFQDKLEARAFPPPPGPTWPEPNRAAAGGTPSGTTPRKALQLPMFPAA